MLRVGALPLLAARAVRDDAAAMAGFRAGLPRRAHPCYRSLELLRRVPSMHQSDGDFQADWIYLILRQSAELVNTEYQLALEATKYAKPLNEQAALDYPCFIGSSQRLRDRTQPCRDNGRRVD